MIIRLLLLLGLCLGCAAPASAQTPLDRLQRTDGASVVPDHFLRRWDPLTVLFPTDTGPATPAAEDAPERFVTLTPKQPGAWRWLGPRVLQFRPSEPWTPLARVRVAAGGQSTTLVPLLAEPLHTAPDDAPEGIAALDTIALTFPEPVDTTALARLLTVEVRHLPGIDATGAQMLTALDFDIRALDRAARGDPQTYLVLLHTPLPDARLAILRLRLSDAAGLDAPIFEKRLHTATPFTLEGLACGDGYNATIGDGVTQCAPEGSGVRRRSIMLNFSAPPAKLDIIAARNSLRISPPIDDLGVSGGGADARFTITGNFAADTEYTLRIMPGTLADARGRPLDTAVAPERFAFRRVPPALGWDAAQGIAERLGPQMLPLHGHGYDRADLRIHRIDPLDRDFWPFPKSPVMTSDDAAPPLPGNEPAPWTGAADVERRGHRRPHQGARLAAGFRFDRPAADRRRRRCEIRHRSGALSRADRRPEAGRRLPGRAAAAPGDGAAMAARAGHRFVAHRRRGGLARALQRHLAGHGAARRGRPAARRRSGPHGLAHARRRCHGRRRQLGHGCGGQRRGAASASWW